MPASAQPGAAARTATYTFQQPPASAGGAAGYRDPFGYGKAGSGKAGNIMSDRRVVRGNTFAPQVLPRAAQEELQRAAQQADRDQKRSLLAAKRQAAAESRAAAMQRAATPPALDGRQHMDVQTEQYLEELTDKPEETAVETQTDPMLDRPATPQYVPFKVGRDAETQIDAGDLFDFDTAADGILDVVVGKTLEQAMLEVLQEEELEQMRAQQMEFEQRRKEELLEAQRLEAAERRRFEETERRKQQELARIKREKDTRDKLQARMFAKSFMSNMEDKVFGRLQDEGWFHDAVKREVELEFVPWLLDAMDGELEKRRAAKRLVAQLLGQAAASAAGAPAAGAGLEAQPAA